MKTTDNPLNLFIDNTLRARTWLSDNFHESRFDVYRDNITIYCMSGSEKRKLTKLLVYQEGDISDRKLIGEP